MWESRGAWRLYVSAVEVPRATSSDSVVGHPANQFARCGPKDTLRAVAVVGNGAVITPLRK